MAERQEYCTARGAWCDNDFSYTDDAILTEIDEFDWGGQAHSMASQPPGDDSGDARYADSNSCHINHDTMSLDQHPMQEARSEFGTQYKSIPFTDPSLMMGPHLDRQHAPLNQVGTPSMRRDDHPIQHSVPNVIPLSHQLQAVETHGTNNDMPPMWLPDGPNPAAHSQPSTIASQAIYDASPITTVQELAQAHLRPANAALFAVQEADRCRRSRSNSASSRPATPDVYDTQANTRGLQTSQDLNQRALKHDASIDHSGFNIHSPGNTPSHDVPRILLGHGQHHQAPVQRQVHPLNCPPLLQHSARLFDEANNPSYQFVTGLNTQQDDITSQLEMLEKLPVDCRPVTPERQTFEFAEQIEPHKNLTSPVLKSYLNSSDKPTFRVHDTPPDVDNHAKRVSEEAKLIATPDTEVKDKAKDEVKTAATPEHAPRKITRDFLGTPVRSDIIMNETNWGEHVLTPTMNRQIRSRSRSASPKKNTTPVLNIDIPSNGGHWRKPTQELIPVFSPTPSSSTMEQMPLGQRIEKAIDYANKVKKADQLIRQSPAPASPLQKRALELNDSTTEVVKNKLRELGERVSGPKRELVRRLLHQEVREGLIESDTRSPLEHATRSSLDPTLASALTERSSTAPLQLSAAPATDQARGDSVISAAPPRISIPESHLAYSVDPEGREDSPDPLAIGVPTPKKRGRPGKRVSTEPRMETWVDPAKAKWSEQSFDDYMTAAKLDAAHLKAFSGSVLLGAKLNPPGTTSKPWASEAGAKPMIQTAEHRQNEPQEPAPVQHQVGGTHPTEDEERNNSIKALEAEASHTTVTIVETPTLQTDQKGALSTPSKRKRRCNDEDDDFNPFSRDGDYDTAAEDPHKKQLKGKAKSPVSSTSTPVSQTKKASRAQKRNSGVNKELEALKTSGLDGDKDQDRSMRDRRGNRKSR